MNIGSLMTYLRHLLAFFYETEHDGGVTEWLGRMAWLGLESQPCYTVSVSAVLAGVSGQTALGHGWIGHTETWYQTNPPDCRVLTRLPFRMRAPTSAKTNK